MDFFARQDAARRQTRKLVGLFVLAVVAIVASVYLAVRLLIFKYGEDAFGGDAGFFVPRLFGWVAGLTLAVIVVGSLYKIAALRQGGEAIARLLGGRPIEPNTTDLAERRLLNVVEEMALAAGVRVPPVYVLDQETAINAFAAGFTPNDAILAVTRGTLQQLGRDELQGVIGHELSHVLNGDMRLNLRLMGLLHGIFVIALIGYWILRGSSGGRSSSSSKKGGGGAIVLFGLALLAIGGIGLFFGRLIKAAVSRQREFLADAASVQFTRNPAGLAGALQKIGGSGKDGAKLTSAKAEQASHLYFADGMGKRFLRLLATHPPLAERVRAIDPSFTGEFQDAAPETLGEAFAALGPEQAPTTTAALAGHAAERAATRAGAAAPSRPAASPAKPRAASRGRQIAVTPQSVRQTVGQLEERHLAHVNAVLAALPPGLREGAREPTTAQAIVLGLLLDRHAEVRARQIEALAAAGAPELVREGERLEPLLAAVAPEARLPLVDLALPALRRLSAAQYQTFSALVDRLVEADARIGLFELTLQRLLRRHLAAQFARQKPQAGDESIATRAADCTLLLSALAWCGHEQAAEAERAVTAGAAALAAAGVTAKLHPIAECGLGDLDQALGRLARLTSSGKRTLLDAAVATVAADGRVTVEEAELLRAVADVLDVPVPPMTAGQAA